MFCSDPSDAGLPTECLRAFGHEEGNTLDYRGESVPVHVLTGESARELDVLFLAVDAAQSREIMAGPGASVPLVVDNSSAFRLADAVPLVVPEANAHAARDRGGNLIANPNCTTAAAVVALAPIRDLAGLASVDLPPTRRSVGRAARASMRSMPSEARTIATAPMIRHSTAASRTRSCRRSTSWTRQAGPVRRRRSTRSCARSSRCPISTLPPPPSASLSTPATRSRFISGPSAI